MAALRGDAEKLLYMVRDRWAEIGVLGKRLFLPNMDLPSLSNIRELMNQAEVAISVWDTDDFNDSEDARAACESVRDTCRTVLTKLDILLGGDDDDGGNGDESDASTVRTFWTNVREPCYSQFSILCRTNARARRPKRNGLRMIVHRRL